MVILRVLVAAAALALLASCPGYSPEFIDCKVKCSSKGTCPSGRECKGGFCRPPGVMTNCDCTPGAQRACGGGMGQCIAGVQSCTNSGAWGVCVGEAKSTPEICDNKDNDCNGSVDDEVTDSPMCPKTKGVCAGTTQKCVGGSFSGTCETIDYGPYYEVLETRCDTFDNDCDGLVDGTQPSVLMTNVSEFELADFDGGFSIVGIEETAGGAGTEYQVVLLRLTPDLIKRGPLVPVSPPAQPSPLNLAARANGAGTTFVAWTARADDAGVQLAAIDSNGIVSQFPAYLDSEKAGDLSLGVSTSKVLVAWPAHFAYVGRMVSWDLADGGITTRDFGRRPDGGYNEDLEYYSARLSPAGKVIGLRGYNNYDAGTSFSLVTELQGTRSSTAGLGARYQFVEVGPLVQSGWSYNSPGFPFFFIDPSSGFEFKNDALAATSASSLKNQADQNIKTGSIGRGQSSAVVAWTDRYVSAVLATPFGNGAQARQKLLITDAGLQGELELGHAGGPTQMVGVFWRDTISGPGNISGMLVCQP